MGLGGGAESGDRKLNGLICHVYWGIRKLTVSSKTSGG